MFKTDADTLTVSPGNLHRRNLFAGWHGATFGHRRDQCGHRSECRHDCDTIPRGALGLLSRKENRMLERTNPSIKCNIVTFAGHDVRHHRLTSAGSLNYCGADFFEAELRTQWVIVRR